LLLDNVCCSVFNLKIFVFWIEAACMFMRCTNILNTEIPFFLSTFIVAVFSDGYRYLYYINGVTYIMFSTSLWKFELY